MDLPGADAKVSAITIASQPQATSAIALAILPNGRSRAEKDAPSIDLPSIIIEVLDARAPGLESPLDIDEAVDPNPQAGPAKAGFGVEIERKQF